MIVVDATAWIAYLVQRLPVDLTAVLNDKPDDLVAPPHVDFEVGSALRRMERQSQIDVGAARSFITAFSRLPLRRLRAPDDAVHALWFTENATYADAWYLALADRLGAAIMTTDTGMIAAARIKKIAVVERNHQE
ncbi:MAG: type II toxin-antitoxin system VapC family toxin [Jiangellaceae bacterium]